MRFYGGSPRKMISFLVNDVHSTNTSSSLPVLRKLGVLKEGRDILKNENSLSMIKVWLALEVRQFINASIQDINTLVKSDMLSPNI